MELPTYDTYKPSAVDWIDEIPSHWETWKVTHGFNLVGSGTTPKSDNYAYYENGETAWVTTSELRENVIFETKFKLTKEALRDYSTLKVYKPGALVFAMYGATIGRLGILGIKATVNQACCVFDGAEQFSTKFFFYWLWMRRDVLISLSVGGGQPNLSQDDLKQIRAPIPPIYEQQKIATFLDYKTKQIDQLIEKKKALIEKLEEKRIAVITQAVTKGLDKNAKFKQSGVPWLGDVPEHWIISKLRWFINVGSGDYLENINMKGGQTDETYIPVVGGNGIMAYTDKFNTDEKSLVIGRVGAHCGNVHLINEKSWVTDNALRVKIIDSFDQGYLFWLIKSMRLNDDANKNAQPLITGETVKSRLVPIPSIDEQERIVRYIEDEISRSLPLKKAAQNTISKLEEYRSAVITSAVTGKIDVRNVEIPGEVA